jgi:hypothetical protein
LNSPDGNRFETIRFSSFSSNLVSKRWNTGFSDAAVNYFLNSTVFILFPYLGCWTNFIRYGFTLCSPDGNRFGMRVSPQLSRHLKFSLSVSHNLSCPPTGQRAGADTAPAKMFD